LLSFPHFLCFFLPFAISVSFCPVFLWSCTLSVCLSVSVSHSLSLSLSLSLSISISISLSLSLCVFHGLLHSLQLNF
jgi:hypothetical protein